MALALTLTTLVALLPFAIPRSVLAAAVCPLRPHLERLWRRYPGSYDGTAGLAGFLVALPVVAGIALVLWLVG